MQSIRKNGARPLALGAMVLALLCPGAASAAMKDLNAEIQSPPSAPSARPGRAVTASLSPIGPSVVPVGTPIRFRITSNRSGFGHLYIVNTSGKVLMLVENIPLKANRPHDLPRGGVVLRAAPPVGDNQILFLVTRDRLAGFANGATSTTPADVQVTPDGLVSVLKARLADWPRERWAYTDLVIRVTE